jgi:hypothetical protein
MMRDRNSAPDTSFPFRPYYHCPARLGTISDWRNPRGIRMWWRGRWDDGTTSTSYPDWPDEEDISNDLPSHIGGTITNGKTLTVYIEFTGRVMPFVWRFTERRTASGGAITDVTHNIAVTGPGEITYSITAPAGGSATVLSSGNQYQFNLPDN